MWENPEDTINSILFPEYDWISVSLSAFEFSRFHTSIKEALSNGNGEQHISCDDL